MENQSEPTAETPGAAADGPDATGPAPYAPAAWPAATSAAGPDTERVTPVVAAAPDPPPVPGWYLDPWNHAQHRYWDGTAWTAETFPNGPGPSMPGEPIWRAEPRPASETTPPPPPAWTPPPAAGGLAYPPPPLPPTPRRDSRAFALVALAVGLAVGFLIAFAIGSATHRHGTSRSADAPLTVVPRPRSTFPLSPPTTAPGNAGGPASSDPSASALQGLVLKQADVAGDLTVQPIPRGDQVAGEVTLDLCNATFPSEAQRTARLQVAAVDAQGSTPLSTEAVLYGTPNGSAKGFTELKAAAASCPSTPKAGPNGATVTTHLNPAPDASWPATATVERLAFDFSTTDQLGQTEHFVAVYLRRGRVLEGVYFSAPDAPQPPVAGKTTIPDIVGVFAARIAQLPAGVVNG